MNAQPFPTASRRAKPFLALAYSCALGIALTLACTPTLASSPATPTEWPALDDDTPPVFKSLSFKEAKEQATKEKKLLVVAGTADWCVPCKSMERTTWRDARVTDWIKAHALAIRVDVEADEEAAKELRMTGLPVVVGLRDGVEVQRASGYLTPESLVRWLEELRSGKPSLEDALTKLDSLNKALDERTRLDREEGIADAPSANMEELYERFPLVEQILAARRFERGTEELERLWSLSRTNASPVRDLRIAMIELVAMWAVEHEPLQSAFTRIRDDLRTGLDASLAPPMGEESTLTSRDTIAALSDWIRLCLALREPAKVDEWLTQARATPALRPTLNEIETDIVPLLSEHDRFDALATLLSEPAIWARVQSKVIDAQSARTGSTLNDVERLSMREYARTQMRRRISLVYAALLVQNRGDEAQSMAKEALKIDTHPAFKLSLVSAALDRNQPLEIHREWLNAAKAAPAEKPSNAPADNSTTKPAEPTATLSEADQARLPDVAARLDKALNTKK